jgi:hypothetical protein
MTFLAMTDRFLRSAKVVAAMIALTGAPGAAWAQGASKPLSASGAAERQQAAYPDTVLASSRGRVD